LTQSTIRQLVLLLPAISSLAACSGGDQAPSSKWTGKTFKIAIPEENWSKPQNIGSDIGAYVPHFLFGIEKGKDNNLTITVGAAPDGTQDKCVPTTEITTSGANYPDSEITVTSLPLRIKGKSGDYVKSNAHNVSFKNVLPGDTEATQGTFAATVDIGELYPLFQQLPPAERTKDGVCSQLSTVKANCAACPDDSSQIYCLTLEAVDLGAALAPNPVQKIASSDIDSSCQ
jgi:hypothetical protein